MEKITVILKKGKETPRTIRFQTDDENALVGNVYVSKKAFDGKVPEAVTVTVEAS